MPHAWLLFVVGLCLLAAVVADVAYVSGQGGGRSAQAANAQYPLPEVTVVLRLHDPVYGMRRISPIGGPCKGLRADDGILGGTQVLVKDQTGAVIGTGAVDIGKVAAGSTCEFAFVVQGVPKADVYQFVILDRVAGTYRYDQLDGSGWQVDLSLA